MAFIVGLLDAMGIKGEARALSNEEGMYIDISGEDMGRIIGYRGETLDAMQYLASMVENKAVRDVRECGAAHGLLYGANKRRRGLQ